LSDHLWERLKRHLHDLGFESAGCIPLSEAQDPGVLEWLKLGYHGSMSYMERHGEIRQAPSETFGDFQTVVVVTLHYGDGSPPLADPLVGNISRYALGKDYHIVLKERLLNAAESLVQIEPGLRARAFVDAGPLNEKRIAEQAGLGWVGKHTNLIDARSGSYFFLGLLLLSAALPSTGPSAKDRCGLCTACLPACPTGAIVAPYVLDARRCLSYLTIEHRGMFPLEFRRHIGNRIFGCDDCQEVCPWNRFAKREFTEPFKPRDGLRDRTLAEWFRMDEQEWRKTFAKSAVKRAKYQGFRRNVLVAIGASREESQMHAALDALQERDPIIRAHGVWATRELSKDDAFPTILATLAQESDPHVQNEIQRSPKEFQNPE
jgi:epoxyqueuosine reductase